MDQLSTALRTQVTDIVCDLLRIETPGDVLLAEVIPEAILRESQVLALTGLSRSTIRRRIADGEFPAPVKLGDDKMQSAAGWLASEIVAWMRSLRRIEAEAA